MIKHANTWHDYCFQNLVWEVFMLQSTIKIALRNIKRHKGQSFISIFGLAVGLASCILILLYVQHELSYDKHFDKANQICRILSVNPEDSSLTANSPYLMGPELKNEFPGVVDFVRFYNFWGPITINRGETTLSEKDFLYTDSSALDIFSFNLIKGSPETALKEPYSLIISEKAAQKYFGDDEPIGQTLTIDNQYEFTVTGVTQDVPENSHFTFDFLAFDPQRIQSFGSMLNQWHFANFKTYLLLSDNFSYEELEEQIPDFIERHMGKSTSPNYKSLLQSLTKIHLYSSHIKWDFDSKGDISTVTIFSVTALLILLIAGFNYVNLSITQSFQRAKEVAMRKVVGAHRTQLMKQFMRESMVLAILAFLLSIVLVELSLPFFNSLIGKNLSLNFFQDWLFSANTLGIALFVGLASGFYPALFLSRFQPVRVIRGALKNILKSSLFQKSFVVVQFVISIALIIGAIIVSSQLHYLHNKNLGFDKEHLLVVNRVPKAYQALKNEWLQNPNITDVTSASSVPPNSAHYSVVYSPSSQEHSRISVKCFFVDHNFIETLGIKITKGRSFSRDFATDEKQAVIINETASQELGWTSPLGKKLTIGWNQITGKVIGVVEDFHFKTLYDKIEPVVFSAAPNDRYVMAVRIQSENIPNTLTYLKNKWEEFTAQPFTYHFVDESFESLYRDEQRLSQIVRYFSILAVFLACLGLLGLASYTAKQRTKEIGIRKVLGASASGIAWLFIKEFSKWILSANFIAWPIAWIVLSKWLQNFAYQINISWLTFVFSGTLALVIALLTVSYQAFRSANINPVKTLRYE
jgi:putative ABC transport system permease protein